MVDNTESVNELNERIRELNDTLSTFSSSMQTQMRSMSGHTQALGQNTNLINQNNTAVSGSTKLAEAQQVAEQQQAKAQQNLVKSLDSTETAVVGFAKAMVSAQAGFGKYGSAVQSAGDAVFNLGKSFGIVGTVLGGLVKGVSLFAGEALKMHDNMIQLNRDITKFAGVIPTTNRNIADLSARAGYAGEKMAQLGKMTESIGSNLVSLGVTAGKGAVQFLKMADVGDEVKMRFSKLGVSQEDLTAMQAQYVKLQGMSGQAYKLQTMDMRQLREQSTAYAENLVKMSAITGKSAEEQQRREEIMRSQYEERSQIINEENQARQLEKDGRQEEADALRASSKVRQGVGDVLSKTVGTETAAMITRVMRVGSFDKVTAGLAASGFTVERIKALQQAGMDAYLAAGTDAKKQQEAANNAGINTLDQYKKIATGVNETLGTALQYGGEELGKKFALTGEGLGYLAETAGMTAREQIEAANKEMAAKDAANDKDAAARAELEAKERAVQEAYQSVMLDLANIIIPGVLKAMDYVTTALGKFNEILAQAKTFWSEWGETIKTGTLILGGMFAAFAGYKIISGVWGAFSKLKGVISGLAGWISKLFGGGGGPAAPGKPAAPGGAPGAPVKGADGRYRDAQGRFAKAPAAPSGGGKLAKLAKGGARILGKLALPLTAVMAGYDAYQGFNADPKASFGGKMANAGKGVLSGLTFGLSDYVTGGVTTGKEEAEIQEKATETKKTNAETISKHSDTVTTDTTQRKANIEQNKKLATDTKAQMVEQTNLFKLLTESIKLTTSSFEPLRQSINDLVTQLGTSILNMQGMGGGGADTIATTSAVMAMQLAKESAGGTQLRTKGLSNSKGIGGAYGMSEDARADAFKAMSKEEQAAFTAATGFSKAPTLNELVNKEGTAFLSDKAKRADQMLATKHNETLISGMAKKLGRPPTMRDIRGANWLGPSGYPAFLIDLAANPNMTMEQFYANHPEWPKPGMEQFNNGKMTLQQFQDKLTEHAGGAGGGSDIVSIGKNLQSQGFRVDEHPSFGGVTPGVHKGKGHDEGRAIDVNAVAGDDSKDPVAAARMDALKQQLSSNPNLTILWRSKDHFDHMHVETKKLTAARGGVFSGPRSGYPIEMHGTEMVAPLNVDSILMKLAKTPAGSVEAETAINAITQTNKSSIDVEKIVAVQASMIEILGNKLDTMIDALESGNKTQSKILRHSL